MSTALSVDFLTPEEYLEIEERSPIKHEYIGGQAYAMAGASIPHNIITGNFFAALHSHLRGGPCRVFMADVRLRLSVANQNLFYYPDIFVTCDARDKDDYECFHPTLIVEVLSESTDGTDRREKLLNYIQLESLQAYVLLEQQKTEAIIYRRQNDWRREILNAAEQVLSIPSLSFSIPLRVLYEGAL
jgi:Uma2 family endonuclease